jgi:hypothetical protein
MLAAILTVLRFGIAVKMMEELFIILGLNLTEHFLVLFLINGLD